MESVMLLLIGELIVSLVFVVLGANYLISGASSIAKKTGLSDFIIGALIVGFGTSCPELVVSVTGAIEGNPDIAIGNVIGSNIFNTLLILGLTAILFPISITEENKKHDIPWLIGLTSIFLILALITTQGISIVEGCILLTAFIVYLISLFRRDHKTETNEEGTEVKEYKTLTSVGFIIGGFLGLVVGGKYFVDSAVDLAKIIGVSDKFIAITVLAVGTSLPEFATCVIAALRKKSQMALGDIIGSNIFNLIFILGVSAIINPLSFTNIEAADIIALSVSSLIFCLAYIRKEPKFRIPEGVCMLALFGIYYWHLFSML